MIYKKIFAPLMTSFFFLVLILNPLLIAEDVISAPNNKQSNRTAASKKTANQKSKKSNLPNWDKVTEGARKLEGLFNLYFNEKSQNLFLEIRKDQYLKNVICPIAISRGAGRRYLGGNTLNFGNQWILSFKRVGNRVLVIRRNVLYRAKKGSPQADAVQVSYTDSVIASLRIRSESNDGLRVLVNLADLFMANLGGSDFAGLGFIPDRHRSTWGKIKAFPKNIEIKVNTVFSQRSKNLSQFLRRSTEVPDPRGTQLVMHYGFSMLPENNYKPRLADDRVGHFLSVVKDYSSDLNHTAFVRYVTRWNLEKSDPEAKRSVPKEPIIFWIEKTVPRQYRPYIREGILEWNRAFEQIGFIDAIQVRDQQAVDEFDPEDIRFNTFRWITTSSGFARGPSRTNPMTGQILDADIIFDQSMVRLWREDYLRVAGLIQGLKLLKDGERQAWFKLYAAEMPWITLAEPVLTKWLQTQDENGETSGSSSSDEPMVSYGSDPLVDTDLCQLGPGMMRQLGLLATVLIVQNKTLPGGKVPEKYIGQAIKMIVMHEVGHTLGLRHNFKASSILDLKEVNNPEITGKRGMSGSVLDYLPVNFAPKGETQGDYFTTTIGPYDFWAIEYAYKPIKENETEALKKIASRSVEPDLIFGTDQDLRVNPDPRINTFDLGDPLDYAKERVRLVKSYLDDVAERVVSKGEGWQRARIAFAILLGELSQATNLSAQYIGAEYTSRDHRGDPGAHDPFEPVPASKQRETIEFLKEHILSDQAFQFDPSLLKKLAPRYWDHWGTTSYPRAFHFPVLQQILSIQRIVLARFLDPNVLRSLQNIELHASEGQEVIKMPEVFESLTQSIWNELPEGDKKVQKITISTIRRNLQREHFIRLAQIVLGPRSKSANFFNLFFSNFASSSPADGRSLARQHLRKLGERIQSVLSNGNIQMDAYTRSHLEDIRDQNKKVFDASLVIVNP